jgi:hypothetical protein
MLTLVVWFFFFLVQTAYAMLMANPDFDKTGRWTRMFETVHWVVPKTQDIPVIAGRLMGAEDLTAAVPVDPDDFEKEEDRRQFRQSMDAQRRIAAAVDPWSSIGSSLAVEAVVIAIALWCFNRRDL